MLTRRKFLQVGSLGLGCLFTGSAGALCFEDTTGQIELSKISLPCPDLPANLEDYRLAFLSDIHLGPFIPYEWVEQAISLIKGANPDLVLLGGDYLNVPESLLSLAVARNRNSELASLRSDLIPVQVFRRLKDFLSTIVPPDGIYAVYGNHDRWLAPAVCAKAFSGPGIRLLVNERVTISRGEATLTVIGADDYWTGIPRLPDLAKRSRNEYRILLEHNPDFVAAVLDSKKYHFDLALCGHTHGGQIRLPGVGPLLYNIEDHRFAEGLVAVPNGHVFTSRGLGVVEIPYRLNCPPEVSIVTLKRV